LTKEGSNEVIDRGNVSVAAASLKPGQTMDIAVTVNNVTRAGTYTGTIKFWLPEQTEADAQVVKLTLQVGPRIVVSPPTGSSAHVAHCGILPCSWSGWLPQNLIGSSSVQLEARPGGVLQPFRSGEILLAPGSVVDFVIGSQIFNSTVTRRPSS